MRTDATALFHRIRHLSGRLPFFAVAVAIGIGVASLAPQLSEAVRAALGLASGTGVAVPGGQEAIDDASQRKRDAASNSEQPAVIKLTNDQIAAAGIELAPVQDGTLAH